MASISRVERMGEMALPRNVIFSYGQEFLAELKGLCFDKLWPKGLEFQEVKVRGSKFSYYPNYHAFMPCGEWVVNELDGAHSKTDCTLELQNAADLIKKINPAYTPTVHKLTSKAATISGVFKQLFDSKDAGVLLDKTQCEIFRLNNALTDANFDSVVSELYCASNGHCMPIILLGSSYYLNDWDEKAKNDALNALIKSDIDIADKGLAPLLLTYKKLQRALENLNGSTFVDEIVSILAGGRRCSEILLESEQRRVNHQRLPEKTLKDPNLGHWDLWPAKENNAEKVAFAIAEPLYGRNPLVDVDKTAVIGIDFGTKSTIVAKWSGRGDAEVLRIGLDDFTKAPESHHYENPTMIEFVDIESFVRSYEGDGGRPYTRWADLKTSHEARGDLNGLGSNDVELSQAFFSSLKQWAGYGDRKVIVNDVIGKSERELLPYEELKPGDFDPIEIYAYHIGLAVNNMSGRQVVLKYLLSFPATFTLNAQQRILVSFKRGILRSIPQPVLEDPSTMKSFCVVGGASEPAAYAVCALRTLGLEPGEGCNIPFAVFDFGGGTTDFDFGLWRFSTEDEYQQEDVDYAIEHFGSGGDAFLGGENLLEDIAYLVYVANRDVLVTKESQYPFAPPHDDIKKESGYETLLVDSREGRMNRYRIAERLRTIWEESEGLGKDLESGEVKVSLFDVQGGKAKENVALKVDAEKLKGYIRSRIATCVDSFVESLQQAFVSLSKEEKDNLACPIHIFLAGNSSKSRHVRELMQEKLEAVQHRIEKVLEHEKRENESMFQIHLPLGLRDDSVDSLALDETCQRGDCDREQSVDFAHMPTGKTGVAFGLVESAPGRRIKVINANKTATGETHFRYFVGRARRDLLMPILTPDAPIGAGWVDFCSAEKPDGISYLYYARSGLAQTGNYKVKDAFCVPVEFEPSKGRILVRASGVSEIEWCVGMVGNDGVCYPVENAMPTKVLLTERV